MPDGPLRMEAEASGAGSVNMRRVLPASCPETSCEHMNGLLDRAMLIGDQTGTLPGFFTWVQ